MTPVQWMMAGAAAAVIWAGLWYWFRTRLRYVIGQTSLRVVFGKTTVRRVPFEEILRIRKPRRSPRGGLLKTGAMDSSTTTGC